MIKAGTSDDYLDCPQGENAFFLSSTVIPKGPSTKPRDKVKRSFVLGLEIEELRRSFNPQDFPLSKFPFRRKE